MSQPLSAPYQVATTPDDLAALTGPGLVPDAGTLRIHAYYTLATTVSGQGYVFYTANIYMETTIQLSVLQVFGKKLLENTEDLPPQIADLLNRRFSELL